MKILRENEFIGLHAYHLPKLAKLLGRGLANLTASIGCLDRGVVYPEYRERRLFAGLMRKGEELAICCGVEILLVASEVDNAAARTAISKLGYVEYVVGTHNGTTCQ